MNKLIAIINNISIVDKKSCVLKTTKNKYYLLKLETGNEWKPYALELFQFYLKESELILWGTEDLTTFSIRYFNLGKDKIVLNSSNGATVKEISSGKALTLLLKE